MPFQRDQGKEPNLSTYVRETGRKEVTETVSKDVTETGRKEGERGRISSSSPKTNTNNEKPYQSASPPTSPLFRRIGNQLRHRSAP